jgi:hypothetical protein
MPYPHSLKHTSPSRSATHPEGSPKPSKIKKISANQHKTRISENYGEGRVAKRNPGLLDAAFWYAGLGLPVFPLHWVDDQGQCSCGKQCGSVGKHPLIPNGHLGATTDPGQIGRWWSRWPDANIGIPTGERSGLLVLDEDVKNNGFISLNALEEKRGRLPKTLTVRTGGGGRHLYLIYPAGCEIRNSVGRLGLGLDVRGEGGYIVAPPSRTDKGSYEFLDRLPPAEPPEWFLEAARTPYRAATDEHGAKLGQPGGLGSATLDGRSIPDGARNSRLTSIAGRLHDGSRDLAALTADLMAIRDARCENPDTITNTEVMKIGRSIHPRPPCKKTGAVPTREVMEALEEIEAELWRRDWPGMGGKSERDAYVALLKAAREHGERIPSGVRVSIGLRSWALASAVSKRAMLDYWKKGERKPGIISRLKMRGLVRADNAGRTDKEEAGAFVLLLPPRAGFHHSSTREGGRSTESASGETLRAPRLRWSAPRYDRVGDEYIRTTIRRLGKSCGAVIDALERAGGIATVEELADALHKSRTRDLRRRTIARLEEAGVVECSGNSLALTGDWLSVLNREREIAGEIAAYKRDMERYAREREAYRKRDTIKPEPVPERLPAGTIDELERVEDADPALVEALAAYLDRRPHRAGETPSWLAVALWADEFVEGKPTPAAVEVALHELVERRAA